LNARNLLLAVTLVLGVIETADIPHTGVAAAVFAVLFFACALWHRRRGSMVAVGILALQFLVEVTQAHTWGVALPFEVLVMALGTIGLGAVCAVVFDRYRRRRSGAARAAAPAGDART